LRTTTYVCVGMISSNGGISYKIARHF